MEYILGFIIWTLLTVIYTICTLLTTMAVHHIWPPSDDYLKPPGYDEEQARSNDRSTIEELRVPPSDDE